MKTSQVLVLILVGMAAGAIAGRAASPDAPILEAGSLSSSAIRSGAVASVYWWHTDQEIEGYTSADEGYFKAKGASITTFTGIDAFATVFPDWVVVESRSGTRVIPREKLVSLTFEESRGADQGVETESH